MHLHPDAEAAGVRLIAYDTLPSTNAEALALARTGERGPLWLTAARQTAGRGRRGNVWASELGNLYASLLLGDAAPAAHLPELCFVVALAVRDSIVEVAPELAPKLKLKWPNDLLLDGAKLAGILIEAESAGDLMAVAAGIGVNCVHHPDNLAYPATSLAAGGAAVAPDELLRALSRTMVTRLAQWARGSGFAAIRAEWLAHAAGLGGDIQVRLPDRELSGRFETLDRIGRLMLRLPGGNLEAITVGEVFAPSLTPTRHASHVDLPLAGGGEREI
jgi:BirA family biotin operon repressor/biotin-[acetyl-CoA-carboxylase] ligase